SCVICAAARILPAPPRTLFMCFGSACPDRRLLIEADSQILAPSTLPAVATHTVTLIRQGAAPAGSLHSNIGARSLTIPEGNPGTIDLARTAITLPNLRDSCRSEPAVAPR